MKKLVVIWVLLISFFLAFSCYGQNDIPCGFYEVSEELKKLNIGSRGGCYYYTPSGNKSYVDRSYCNCDILDNSIENILNNNLIIDKGTYRVSYNETYQQPNWVEYIVSNRKKNVDRGNLDFYEEDGVVTSDDADYYKNIWDKGHLAPAATFSDSYENLYSTFSFLNCALQVNNLNRGEWAELEQQVRDWSATLGNISVRVELVFSDGQTVLNTDARVPTGFWKNLTFTNGSSRCFYFPNEKTYQNWTSYESSCN